MSKVPLAELSERIEKLQQNLIRKGITGALILHGIDLYYYCGYKGSGCLYVPAEGTPVYLRRQRGDFASMPWPAVKYEHWGDLAPLLREFGHQINGRLGLELDVISAAVYLKLAEVFNDVMLVDVSQIIRLQRAVKSAWELAAFKETNQRDLKMWAQVPTLISQAKDELELAGAVEGLVRRMGHIGIVRVRGFNQEMSVSMVLAGEQGALPPTQDAPINGSGLTPAFPFGSSGAPLEPGKPIFIDFASNYFGYTMDNTRNFIKEYIPAAVA